MGTARFGLFILLNIAVEVCVNDKAFLESLRKGNIEDARYDKHKGFFHSHSLSFNVL